MTLLQILCISMSELENTSKDNLPPTLIAPGVVRRAAVQVNVAEARHRHPEPRLVVLAVQGLVLAEPVLKYF